MVLNDKKLAFIICVNDELMFEECLYYIQHLTIPDGFTMDIIELLEAQSIASAYNQAMRTCDAKYKIYMHQDMFLINKDILNDVITLFQTDHRIGMIGILGASMIPADGIMYKAWDRGSTAASTGDRVFHNCLSKEQTEVLAIDGMFMATQYDIEWREDIVKHWDFYDISHSFEFLRNGFKIMIPEQEREWCFHDCGYLNLVKYDEEKNCFWESYHHIFDRSMEGKEVYGSHYRELYSLMMELKNQLKHMIAAGETEKAKRILRSSYDKRFIDTELAVMNHVFEITDLETSNCVAEKERFLEGRTQWEDIHRTYVKMKFLLRRVEYGIGKDSLEETKLFINTNHISKEAVKVIIEHTIIEREMVIQKLYVNK